MNHLVMSKPQCVLYSAAMVMDIDVDYLVGILGHDGLGVENGEMVGIHMQEIQTAYYLMFGEMLSSVELIPVSQRKVDLPHYIVCKMAPSKRLTYMIAGHRAILLGENKRGAYHAVAYDGETIFDPVGKKYPLDDFALQEAWVL